MEETFFLYSFYSDDIKQNKNYMRLLCVYTAKRSKNPKRKF